METPLATFEPIAEGMLSLSYLALTIAIACGAGTVILLRQSVRGRARQNSILIAMLLFFVSMIALGTFIFNTLAYQKVGVIKIYADSIQLGREKIPFAEIENAKIEEAGRISRINPSMMQNQTQILLIARQNGRTYAISSEHYPLKEVLETMRQALRAWEEKPR